MSGDTEPMLIGTGVHMPQCRVAMSFELDDDGKVRVHDDGKVRVHEDEMDDGKVNESEST